MVAPTTGDDYRACTPRPVGGDDPRFTCEVHGGWFSSFRKNACQTTAVLEDVAAERARQFARYGTNSDTPDGTGPGVAWLAGLSDQPATAIQEAFRADYEAHERLVTGESVTWLRLVREEMAEAFVETDPTRLREELIQAAALCVSWAEKIDARERKP